MTSINGSVLPFFAGSHRFGMRGYLTDDSALPSQSAYSDTKKRSLKSIYVSTNPI
jgi:hypothetical protein